MIGELLEGQRAGCFHLVLGVPDKPLGVLRGNSRDGGHAERYSEFAEYLNGRGFEVYACDLRGHGRTGELNGNLCHLDKDGFSGIVEDQKILSDMIMKRRPGVPLFILGHSFGSFILQEYIKRYGNDISGVSFRIMQNGRPGKATGQQCCLCIRRAKAEQVDKKLASAGITRMERPQSEYSS